MSRATLRSAIATASPDQQIISLFEQFHVAEQKWAEARETYGQDHPEVKRARRVVDKIDQQIEARIDGILEGLKTKAVSYKARVQALQQEVDNLRKAQIEASIKQRPYFQLRREIETLQAMRERLQMRLFQEKVDR